MGVPYIPVIGLTDTDLLKRREDMLVLPDPFGRGFKTVVVKAMRPDVALFHGLKADREGNVHFGYESDNEILAEASRTVIVTVEEIVDALTEEERAHSFIPGLLVDAVCEARYGAHPAGAPGAYPVDDRHMKWYAEKARGAETFSEYLHETVHSIANHMAYVERFVPEGWGQAGQLPLQAAGD